jgi:membrane protein DedA with SNARE-associated domain
MLAFIFSIFGIISGAVPQITAFIASYGYLALFILMTLESASVPIPSEVVLPLAGLFAARSVLNFYLSLLVVLIGSMVGIAIDYYIAYFIGKDFVYKNAKKLGIKEETLKEFDEWFVTNGAFAVFISRLIPVVRGLMSFPAGFALMDQKKFFGYSFIGALVWDTVLMLFGYYALAARNASEVLVAIAIFAIIMYAIFHVSMNKIRKRK